MSTKNKEVALSTTYTPPNAQASVLLTILIGDAQIGASAVFVNDQLVGSGSVSKLDLGTGASLKGASIMVRTIVADINDSTNWTSALYRFACGKKKNEFYTKGLVEANGDVITHKAIFFVE